MRNSPEWDRGNDRDRPSHRPTTGEPITLGGRFRTWSFTLGRQTAFGKSSDLAVCKCRLEAFSGLRSADLSSKAAETLRCARSAEAEPSAEAAVTRDRRDRERHAGRSRGGGAESAGWREVAEWCHATEGTGHE